MISPTSSTSLANQSPRCSTVLADVEQTLSLLYCQMHETESSALVIPTAQSILRSMEHTEPEPSELEQEYPAYIYLICDEVLASPLGSVRAFDQCLTVRSFFVFLC